MDPAAASQPSPQDHIQVLRSRALKLAAPPDAQETGQTLEIVEFRLGKSWYALEAHHVQEAYPLREFTPLPGTPAWVWGVVNIRSQVLTVVDLGPFLGIALREVTPASQLLILQADGWRCALLVDEVGTARHLLLAELQTGGNDLISGHQELIKGITSNRLTLLDGEALLDDTRLVVQ